MIRIMPLRLPSAPRRRSLLWVQLLFNSFFLCASLSGQTGRVSFSGRLYTKETIPAIYIHNADSIHIRIPVDAQNRFSFLNDSIPKGFYEVDEIGTIYLCPGYMLNIQPGKEGAYFFTGTGDMENNALRAAKKQLTLFIPVSPSLELLQEAYYMDLPVFLQKLDSFQRQAVYLINKSTDPFFRSIAIPDLQFYSREILLQYATYYGRDMEKTRLFHEMQEKTDSKEPGFAEKVNAAYQATRVKTMNMASMVKLNELLYKNWDKNVETLFRHSLLYRQALSDFLQHESTNPKYRAFHGYSPDPAEAEIKKLRALRGEISNLHILAHFEYTITASILKTTKDTAILNKYYEEYLARALHPAYRSAIKELYENATSFRDNMPAPGFSYKDVSGNIISLESFRGKYVYIDVWATWCIPCKAEIPYLQDVAASYHNKNIAFVSISVDVLRNFGKWKKYIKDNQLNGIQLMADSALESGFIQKMNIESIPRFILIDPAGKIITADALRPSNTGLRDMLNKLL